MHLGLIMDGNGRWATQRHLPRAAGHLEGMKACKRIILAAKNLTLTILPSMCSRQKTGNGQNKRLII